MEDVIHKSGPAERWRWESWAGATAPDRIEAAGNGPMPSPTGAGAAGAVAQALRRTLDILKQFPEALDAVQLGLRDFIEAPS